jgi:hypothetical protein
MDLLISRIFFRQDAFSDSIKNQLCLVVEIQFPENIGAIGLNRSLADTQITCNPEIIPSLGGKFEYFSFSGS